MSFQDSTQARGWTFKTPEALAAARRRAPARPASPATTPAAATAEEDEEARRVRRHERRLTWLCAAIEFRDKIQWTALIYFKRFFITNSLADHDPDLLIVTCIFLAGKIEEYRISLHQLCDMIENATAPKPHAPGIGQIRVTAAKVMECELGLLAGLRFNLIVYHPHRSFRGFTADWCKFAESNKIRQPDADALIRTGNKFLHEVMLTDVPLIYTPGQIALAALHHVLTTVEPFSSDKELLSSHQKYINAKLCKVPWLPQLTTSVIPSILAMVSPQSRNPSTTTSPTTPPVTVTTTPTQQSSPQSQSPPTTIKTPPPSTQSP